METPRRVDEAEARARFERALADHEQAFERFFLARLLDLRFEYLPREAPDAERQACRIRFPVSDFLFNPQGSMHGGAIAIVLDISMGHLIKRVAGPGATLDMSMRFLRPLLSGEAVCEARFLRRGRSVSFLESRLWDEEERLVAVATGTWKMPKPPA